MSLHASHIPSLPLKCHHCPGRWGVVWPYYSIVPYIPNGLSHAPRTFTILNSAPNTTFWFKVLAFFVKFPLNFQLHDIRSPGYEIKLGVPRETWKKDVLFWYRSAWVDFTLSFVAYLTYARDVPNVIGFALTLGSKWLVNTVFKLSVASMTVMRAWVKFCR